MENRTAANMINAFMKSSGEKSFRRDLQRIDFSKIPDDIVQHKDAAYISDGMREHMLDVYYRDDNAEKPVLIDIHGGGFISHDKEINRLFGTHMAEKGFLVFNVNYRLAYPDYNVFDQVCDINDAVGWIIDHLTQYGGDKERMYIAGHSSGGVLAAAECLLCQSDKMLQDFQIDARDYCYRGLILDCGLMEFYRKSIAYWGMRRMVFSGDYQNDCRYQDLIFEHNPELNKLPPTVVITNNRDQLKAMSYYFNNLLCEKDVSNLLIDRGKAGHMGILFQPDTEESLSIMDEMMVFLRAV